MTLRELIRRRIYQEVTEYNAKLSGCFRGLVQPTEAECALNGDGKAEATPEGVFLPFEGDSVFSIILSKAFLLAEDTKISDPTITRQIGGR